VPSKRLQGSANSSRRISPRSWTRNRRRGRPNTAPYAVTPRPPCQRVGAILAGPALTNCTRTGWPATTITSRTAVGPVQSRCLALPNQAAPGLSDGGACVLHLIAGRLYWKHFVHLHRAKQQARAQPEWGRGRGAQRGGPAALSGRPRQRAIRGVRAGGRASSASRRRRRCAGLYERDTNE
jgi:hypothetical protein